MAEKLAQKPVESISAGSEQDVSAIVEMGAEFTDKHEQKMEEYGQKLAEASKADPKLKGLIASQMSAQHQVSQKNGAAGRELTNRLHDASVAVADNETFKGLLADLTTQLQSDLQTGEMPRVWTETTQDNRGEAVHHVVTATDSSRVVVTDTDNMFVDEFGERLDTIPLRVKYGDRGSRIVMANDAEIARAAEVMSGYTAEQNEGTLGPKLGSVAIGPQVEHVE